MAGKKWAAFPHPDKAFDYAGGKLVKNWAKLHAGDQEPFPDEAEIGRLIKANGKLGKSADAGKIATALQDGWRAFHRGDFEKAFDAGDAAGPLGTSLACKAMGIHATYLVDDETEQLKRFEQAAKLAEAAIKALPDEANSHYRHAFALGRYSQGLSIANALKQGIAYARAGKSGPGEAELKAKLAANPADHETRLALAALYGAKKRYREAMDELLEIVRRARDWKDGEARKQLLALFNLAADQPDLVSEYRRKLASALY